MYNFNKSTRKYIISIYYLFLDIVEVMAVE